MTRRLIVHLGCSKTGTSSLQAGLWESIDDLAAVGVGVPFRNRAEHLAHLVVPLGWRPVEAYGGPRDEAALAELPQRLRSTPGDVLLISNEDLAEIDRAGAETLTAAAEAADTELHLMITVRGWALQLPSEYQQFLKHRMALSYAEFVDAVRDRTGIWAERYWNRQDAVGVIETFSGLVPTDRIHLVPIDTGDPEAIFTATADLLGVDAGAIRRPGRAVNTSFGAVEAEVFRRVTGAVDAQDSLPVYRDFARLVRRPFVRGVLPAGASGKLRLPPEHLDWVATYTDGVIERMGADGIDVRGDLEVLRPRSEQTGAIPEVSEAEVARVAIETLARYAAYRSEARPGPKHEPTPTPRAPWWRRSGRN